MIDKLIGDEVMAIYLPTLRPKLDVEDVPALMLEHATELLRGVGYGSGYGPFAEMGVGIDVGEAFVGNIGERALYDFTAVGDVVNTASRLQGQAAGWGDRALRARRRRPARARGDAGRADAQGQEQPRARIPRRRLILSVESCEGVTFRAPRVRRARLASTAVLAAVRTYTLDGVAARPVRVEADVHRGLPAFTVVGLPDTAVRESRERVRSALGSCGFEFPLQRITINLAPASLRKAGPGLDLAIAAALLCASGQINGARLADVALAGELALDGTVRPIQGILAIAEAAWRDGSEAIAVPAANGPEAALAVDLGVVALENLEQLGAYAAGEWRPERPDPLDLGAGSATDGPDLADLRGQPALRHALEVAAAGGHSLLMVGPPGAGKSLAARRLPSILPPPALEERLEVARIASACGREATAALGSRPYRAPHHTISAAGLVGGGNPPRAGEITLAHRGVLFLDELCEFSRDALEALREPLETGVVSIARSGTRRSLPCRFMLVAAANPCPCGRGEDDPRCGCAPHDISRYTAKLSGALADRIDIVAALAQPGSD